jgi:hypothetical protein
VGALPEEISAWTPAVHAAVVRSTRPGAAERLREKWEAGEVAAFTNDAGAVLVIEIWRVNDTGELWGVFHACHGQRVWEIGTAAIQAASAAGVRRFRCRANSAAHARLYGRWCRWMQQRGVIERWAIHPPIRQQTSQTSGKTTFSTIPGYQVTLST